MGSFLLEQYVEYPRIDSTGRVSKFLHIIKRLFASLIGDAIGQQSNCERLTEVFKIMQLIKWYRDFLISYFINNSICRGGFLAPILLATTLEHSNYVAGTEFAEFTDLSIFICFVCIFWVFVLLFCFLEMQQLATVNTGGNMTDEKLSDG